MLIHHKRGKKKKKRPLNCLSCVFLFPFVPYLLLWHAAVVQVQSDDVLICQFLDGGFLSWGLLQLWVDSMDQLPVFWRQPQHLNTCTKKQAHKAKLLNIQYFRCGDELGQSCMWNHWTFFPPHTVPGRNWCGLARPPEWCWCTTVCRGVRMVACADQTALVCCFWQPPPGIGPVRAPTGFVPASDLRQTATMPCQRDPSAVDSRICRVKNQKRHRYNLDPILFECFYLLDGIRRSK